MERKPRLPREAYMDDEGFKICIFTFYGYSRATVSKTILAFL